MWSLPACIRAVASACSACRLVSNVPPAIPLPLGTGKIQAKPPAPCEWQPTQWWQEGGSPLSLGLWWLEGRATCPKQAETRRAGEGWPFHTWSHLRSGAEKILLNPCQRRWGLGPSDMKQMAKRPDEDREVILRLTHLDWQRRVREEEVGSPWTRNKRGAQTGPVSGALRPPPCADQDTV